jgi:hypothetical protein
MRNTPFIFPSNIKKVFGKVLQIVALLVIPIFSGCEPNLQNSDALITILTSDIPEIKTVLQNPDRYEVQIRYTRIVRKQDSVKLIDYDFNVDKQAYFYPASTVKFPIAVLALEKLNGLDSLNLKTRYFIEGDTIENSFERDILEIFAVSDNNANNRLMEFLGQNAINDSLKAKGIEPVRIAHRLGVHDDDVTTKPLIWYLNDSLPVQSEPLISRPAEPLNLKGIQKGKAYFSEGLPVEEPFDFSMKNYLPVESLDGILKRIVFPELFSKPQQFRISKDQRQFLLDAMQITPKEAGYNPDEYYDGYCKFFLFGDTKNPIPEELQIFNKVGFAYGTLTDCAYIKDSRNNVEFMLTATILVNSNEIFNDDQYEYDETGLPFLAALGRAVYNYESELRGSSIRITTE